MIAMYRIAAFHPGAILEWDSMGLEPKIQLLSLPKYAQSNEAFVDVLESREVGETVIELCQADISQEEQLVLSLISLANADVSFIVQVNWLGKKQVRK